MFNISRFALFLLVFTCIAACSAGRGKFDTAQKFEAEGRYDDAMFSYAEAVKANPDAPEYRYKFLAVKEKAAQAHDRKGDALYAAGRFVDAVAEYQTASGLDAGQLIYARKSEQAARMRDAQSAFQEGAELEKKNKLRDAAAAYARALDIAPEDKEFKKAVKRLASMQKSRVDGFELQLKSKRPITLHFREARMKDVFNVITQLSGINFIFDDGIKDQNVTINLENATFNQAMELLSGMYKLGYKNLNETTVIIYQRSMDKQKQYEDMVLRTYNLNNLDAKKAINLVRSMIMVKKIFVNDEVNALVFRDTAEVVNVVEKLLEANDTPGAEVLLDVEVVEVNQRDTRNLGLLLSNYSVSMAGFTPEATMLSPSLFTSTAPTQAPVGVSQLLKAFTSKGFGGYVTVPNASYNFGKTLARGEILSNPKIRVKNKEKAKFTVGQRVPFSTTSTQTSGVVSTNVQYVDVGVKVNAEPTIQLNNEVSIRLNLEVSSVIKKETAIDGTTLVTIGTRNIETVLSLKDGETSIIGGLIQNTSTDTTNKVFLLGDVPLLGPLVSNSTPDKDKTELILAITPRLVRGVTVPPASVSSFVSGKEDYPTLGRSYSSFDQEPEFEVEHKNQPQAELKSFLLPQPQKAMPLSTPAPTPLYQPAPRPDPVQQPAPVKEQPQPILQSPPTIVEPLPFAMDPQPAIKAPLPVVVESQPAVRESLQSVANIGFMGPSSVKQGDLLLMPVQISQADRLLSSSLAVIYDPELLDFVSATEGAFFRQDGKTAVFSAPSMPGAVNISVERTSDAGPISGQGTIAVLTFRAKKGRGEARFSIANVKLAAKDSGSQRALALGSVVEIR